MTVSFLALTDTDEIRATLGVDDTDLSDAIIYDRRPEEDLESDLLEWVPTYQTVINEGLAVTPTAEQRQRYLKLKIYSKYFLSASVASSGMNSILHKLSDGSNETARFSNADFPKLAATLASMANQIKSELIILLDASVSRSYSQFGSATPAYDPVTNT